MIVSTADFLKAKSLKAELPADGRALHHDFSDLSNNEKKAQASKFAESSVSLYNLLQFCFDNGLQSYASCSGHLLNPLSKGQPYIAFNVKDMDSSLLEKILTNAIAEDPNIRIEVANTYAPHNEKNDSQSVIFRTERKLFPFDKLLTAFKKSMTSSNENNYSEMLDEKTSQLVKDMVQVANYDLTADTNTQRKDTEFVRNLDLSYGKGRATMIKRFGREFPNTYDSDNGWFQISRGEYVQDDDGKFYAIGDNEDLVEIERENALANYIDTKTVVRDRFYSYNPDQFNEFLHTNNKHLQPKLSNLTGDKEMEI